MKHIKLASALVAAMGIAVIGTASAATSGGTITFTGTVTDTTCSASGGAGTGGGKDNFTVPLDPIADTVLNAQGNGGVHPFVIEINGDNDSNCVAKTAAFTFNTSSPAIDPVTGALKNNLGTKYAQDTEIQLLDSGNQPINLADPAQAALPAVTLTNNMGTIDLSAQYLTPNKSATAGQVETAVQYQVVYN
jgi:major type 1 subunit fimbrin (pilin)